MDILIMCSLTIVFGVSLLLVTARYRKIIGELKEGHVKEIEEISAKAIKASKSSTRGQISEEFAPLFEGFPYKLSDCKFFGNPVDYIIFDGMSEYRDGNKEKDITIVLADVKYNTARLSPVQKAIKQAVEKGRVKFDTVKISENKQISIK